MSKILATDLDGTLMYPTRYWRCIPKKNVKFLRKWIDSGNKVVFITSRGPEFMARLHDELERDFDYISYTSSYIVSDGKVIKDTPMDSETVTKVLDYVSKNYAPVAYLANIKDQPLLIKDNLGVARFILYIYKLYWIIQGKRREKYILNNKYFDSHVNGAEVYKVILFYGLRKRNKKLSKEINKTLIEKFPDVEFSWSQFVNEVTPHNCNKGEGLKYYCDNLNIDYNDVIVVGDSGNDISMFNLFYENSYVMAKASPSVKKYAKHIISRVYKLDDYVFKKGD